MLSVVIGTQLMRPTVVARQRYRTRCATALCAIRSPAHRSWPLWCVSDLSAFHGSTRRVWGVLGTIIKFNVSCTDRQGSQKSWDQHSVCQSYLSQCGEWATEVVNRLAFHWLRKRSFVESKLWLEEFRVFGFSCFEDRNGPCRPRDRNRSAA